MTSSTSNAHPITSTSNTHPLLVDPLDTMFEGPIGTVWFTILLIPRSFAHHTKMDAIQRADWIGFLHSSVMLFPNTKISHDAQQYMRTHKIGAETGQQAFEYTVDMYNDVMTHPKQPRRSAIIIDRIMHARVALESKTIAETEKKHQENTATILELQKEKIRLQTVPQASNNSSLETILIIAVVIGVLAFLAIFFFSLLILKRLQNRY